MRRDSGVTLIEILTVVVVLMVATAVAIPLWRTHELRAQRRTAIDALLAIQAEQDRHFGRNAHYAELGQLEHPPTASSWRFELHRSVDQLSYVATARAVNANGIASDARCAEISIDQHGRKSARDDQGVDRGADCWNTR